MTPMQQYNQEVKEITLQMIKNTMPEPYKIMIELVRFENNPMHMIDERLVMLPRTAEGAYLVKNGFEKCKRKEASAIVYISRFDEDRRDWISIRHHYVKSSAK